MNRKVAVTGFGAVTALGHTAEETWKAMKAGRHGFAPITKMNVSDLKVKIAAEINDFEYADKKEGRRMDAFSQYGVTAAVEAMAMAGLVSGENIDPDKLGVYAGSGIGGITTMERETYKGIEKGFNRVSALLVPMIIGNILAGNIAIRLNARGTALDIVTACSCGTNSIGEAMRAIRHGYLDAVIAGASEAPFAITAFSGFANMTAMSSKTDPDRCSTPFDKERDGFVMGEGAGMLVLEDWEHAVKRGAPIFAEMAGYGSTCDAYHITAPAPKGIGAAKCMEMAIAEADLKPEDISYINAHGTGTPLNDLCETEAMKLVFDKAAYKIPISSTKSMTGHMLGAAGAVEAVACVMAMRDNIVPPTIGLRVPDPELDLDYVPEGSREVNVMSAMSNSLGFGGHNASLVFKKI